MTTSNKTQKFRIPSKSFSANFGMMQRDPRENQSPRRFGPAAEWPRRTGATRPLPQVRP